MSHEVKVDPGVEMDLRELAAEQRYMPEDWRLSHGETAAAIDAAIGLIASLREDPRQGELMVGRPDATVLRGCRRLKFDPADPWPRSRSGRPRSRMRLVWVNEPGEAAIALVRVLAVTHRFDSRPYRRAAARLGAVRRSRGPGA